MKLLSINRILASSLLLALLSAPALAASDRILLAQDFGNAIPGNLDPIEGMNPPANNPDAPGMKSDKYNACNGRPTGATCLYLSPSNAVVQGTCQPTPPIQDQFGNTTYMSASCQQ